MTNSDPSRTYQFRRARLADVPAIVALLADDPLGAERENASLPIDQRYLNAFEDIDRDPNQYLMIATDSSEMVVGVLQVTLLPGLSRLGAKRGQIESVRVARSHRGAGLGRMMFDQAISWCRDQECTLVQLTSDTSRADAHQFYESLGFVASHTGYKLAL